MLTKSSDNWIIIVCCCSISNYIRELLFWRLQQFVQHKIRTYIDLKLLKFASSVPLQQVPGLTSYFFLGQLHMVFTNYQIISGQICDFKLKVTKKSVSSGKKQSSKITLLQTFSWNKKELSFKIFWRYDVALLKSI